MDFPEALKNAAENLAHLPGVGGKSALRHVLAMLNWSKEERDTFVSSINSLNTLKSCSLCGFFCEEDICTICNSLSRKATGQLCVIENVSDLLAIERGGVYQGHYHILGGTLNPLLGIGPESLRLDSLVKRVQTQDYHNVILAINPSVEGDATCAYIADLLKEDTQVERIGFGVPIGGALEYLDPLTISKAIENRQVL